MVNLKGKIALITGAAQGIGKTVALFLAEKGADIAICDINLEKLEEAKKEIEVSGRRCMATKVNVADFMESEQMVSHVIKEFDRIDILVNNAGVARDGLLLRMKEEDWDLVLNINLKGTFNFTKAVVKYMSKQKTGRIVNISSIIGIRGNIGQANYSASKAGIIGFTKSTAREFASRRINVNAIAPGFIDTDMTRSMPEKIKEDLKKQIPLVRLGTPQDIAQTVYFLVSEASSYITGQVINVNGGLYM
jgi:3-oxoacyl-[acyl-carrier protein] reductase